MFPSICLNMIVKNEARVIERLLSSVVPIIDSFIIYDTGSSDETPRIIAEFMEKHGIPGSIFYSSFSNFEANRNQALEKAFEERDRLAADFLLLLDADMVLKIGPDFSKDLLRDVDHVQLLQQMNGCFSYRNTRLVRNSGKFKYIGATHEYVDYPDETRSVLWKQNVMYIEDVGDGGSKADKVERDIRLLEESLEKDPNNVRTFFYLANSYKGIKEYEKAIYWYEKRAKCGGWPEEVFYSYLEMGDCFKELGDNARSVESWLFAHQAFPFRAESLYLIIKHFRKLGMFMIADLFYGPASEIVKDVREEKICIDNFLFVNTNMYKYLLDFENMIISYYAGRRDVAESFMNILTFGDAPIVDAAFLYLKLYKYIPSPSAEFILDTTLQANGDQFVSSSSSLIISQDGKGFEMNQRFVNYFIKEDGSYVSLSDPSAECRSVATVNRRLLLSSRFEILEEKTFETGDTSRFYVGVEDVKIFRHRETTYFVGTALRRDGRLGVSAGEYDSRRNMLEAAELTPEWTPNFACEKNWVFAENRAGELVLIHSWHPIIVGKIKGDKLHKEFENPTPRFLQRARGSTCGHKFGEEWFFVVHFVSYEAPRHYYHVVVVLDLDLRFKQIGKIFSFEGSPIEFCLGIVAYQDEFVLSYSAADRTTRVRRYARGEIM
jgi:glycosyltransferase involved in cell wall biosynthesis